MAPGSAAAITARRLAEVAAADPTLAYPQPDVEALVWRTISHLGEDEQASVSSWAYASNPVPGTQPGWAVAVTMQIDVRDRSKHATFRRADVARRLVQGLSGQSWSDGVVSRVDIVAGPFWLPDLDGSPRYVTQAVVQVHPVANRERGSR